MLKAWRAYKSLSDEQKQIIQQKQVKLHRPIGDLIPMLKGIADMDKQLTWSPFGVGCSMAIVVAVAIAAQIAITAMNLPGWTSLLVLLVAAVAFFAPLAIYLSTRNIDVSDNLRGAALPLLYLFRDDVDPQEPVELELDLRKPMAKEKLARTETPRARLVEEFFVDPWMAMEAVLADGSRLKWSVTDTLRHRAVWKKSSSGKYKHKTKDSKKCCVEVELTVRNKNYAAEGGETGEKKTTVSDRKTVKLASADPVNPRVIAEVVAGVFQRVSPVK